MQDILKATNWLLSLILIVLILIVWQLCNIKIILRAEDTESAQIESLEQIVEVVGTKTNIYNGLGSTSGFVVKVSDGGLVEVPFSKLVGMSSVPQTLEKSGWKPKYLAILIEDGKVSMACQTDINKY